MCCCSANACELRKLYQRVQQISTMWSHRNKQHVTMMVVLLRKILFTAVFIVFLPSGIKVSVVTGASCQQVYIRRPRIGQRCVTSNEVYKNHTIAPQERCMWHCLRDISCKVINYNMDESFCFLSQEPCVTLEPESDIVTMPMTMQEPCMTWVRQKVFPPPLDDISNFVTYPVLPDGGNDPDNKILVPRAIIDSAKVPGKVHIPVNLGHFILNGQVLDFSAGNYEMLTVSPGCDVSWVNYDPDSGNSFPDGAVIGGYLWLVKVIDTEVFHIGMLRDIMISLAWEVPLAMVHMFLHSQKWRFLWSMDEWEKEYKLQTTNFQIDPLLYRLRCVHHR